MLCPAVSEAASMSAFIDADPLVEVGDNFTVVVRFEADADAMLDASFTYDSSVVYYLGSESNDVNEVNGIIRIVPLSAKTTHSFRLLFKMNKAAKADFTVKVNESFTMDMTSLGTPSASYSVTGFNATPKPATPSPTPPSEDPTKAPTPVQTPFVPPTADPNATPSTPLEFTDGGYVRYIAENFDGIDLDIPEGFEKAQYDFRGYNISVLKNKYNIILIYATDILGDNGSLYIYNKEKDMISAYNTWINTGTSEYTFLTYTGDLPDDFKESTVTIGDGGPEVTGYELPYDGYADFVLVYAYTNGGEPGFYLYDLKELTLQRFADIHNILTVPSDTVPSASPSHSPEPSPTYGSDEFTLFPPSSTPSHSGSISRNVIIYGILVLLAMAATCAIIVIIVISRKSKTDAVPEDEADIDAETENNGVTETEAIAEAEAEADTDSEKMSDSDADADVEADAGTEADDGSDPGSSDSEDSGNDRDDVPDDDPDDEILQLRNDTTRRGF